MFLVLAFRHIAGVATNSATVEVVNDAIFVMRVNLVKQPGRSSSLFERP